MRLHDPFREAGWWFRVADMYIHLTCTCGVEQTADDLRRGVSGKSTVYTCKHCDTMLAGIAKDDRVPQPPSDSEGHRMCGFVFGSKVDMRLIAPGAPEGQLDLPRCPGFFAAYA